jgi:hypothetical protein
VYDRASQLVQPVDDLGERAPVRRTLVMHKVGGTKFQTFRDTAMNARFRE